MQKRILRSLFHLIHFVLLLLIVFGFQFFELNPGLQNIALNNAGSGTGHNHAHTLSGTLTGNITTSLTGAVTAAGTNSFSPFVVVNYIIKH